MQVVNNLAALIKVKTIVTLVVIGVFAYLALRGAISADNVMVIVTAVVSFYFGTQHEKNGQLTIIARGTEKKTRCQFWQRVFVHYISSAGYRSCKVATASWKVCLVSCTDC